MRYDLLVILALVIGMIFLFLNYVWTFYAFIFIIALVIIYVFFLKKYDEFERGIIFRMGKFNRVVGPGWVFVIPFFEKEYARIDARTQMLEIEIDDSFTRDDLRLDIDGIFYYKINNPEKAVLKINDYKKGIRNLMIGEVRNTIGNMNMREVFANINHLNEILAEKIRHNTWNWGVRIPMIQLKSVSPPLEIAEAMQSKEIAAQQLQAQRFKAEARKVVINAIGKAAEDLSDRAIMYVYIKALEEMGKGEGTKVLFPAQFMNIVQNVGQKLQKGKGELKDINISEVISQVKDKILESEQ